MSKSGTQSKTGTKVSKKAAIRPKKVKKVIDPKPAHRPAYYNSPDEMQIAIKDYFENCPDKITVITKDFEKIEIPKITSSGLAYYLGFESRQSLYDYAEKPNFSYTIKRALLFIEKEYEKKLDMNNVSGVIFALKNFGWKDSQEIKHSGLKPLEINVENTQQKKKIEDNL